MNHAYSAGLSSDEPDTRAPLHASSHTDLRERFCPTFPNMGYWQRILPALRIWWREEECWIAWIHLEIALPPADIHAPRLSIASRDVPFVKNNGHHLSQFALALAEQKAQRQQLGWSSTPRLENAVEVEYQRLIHTVSGSISRRATPAIRRRLTHRASRPAADSLHEIGHSKVRNHAQRPQVWRQPTARSPRRQVCLL